MTFDEDRSRVRDRTAAGNWALLRKIALNLLQGDAGAKGSLAGRRKKAGWNDAYMERWYGRLRQRLSRYVQRTLSFSKSEAMHPMVTKWFIVEPTAIVCAVSALWPVTLQFRAFSTMQVFLTPAILAQFGQFQKTARSVNRKMALTFNHYQEV